MSFPDENADKGEAFEEDGLVFDDDCEEQDYERGYNDEGDEEEGEDDNYDDDDDDDDENDPHLLPRAFAVDGAPISDPNEPPSDGMDYLRRVRAEAKSIPFNMSSGLDPKGFTYQQTSYIPPVIRNMSANKVGADALNPSWLPTADWRSLLLLEFRNVRFNMAKMMATQTPKPAASVKLPSTRNPSAWHMFCFGVKEPDSPRAPWPETVQAEEHMPVMSVLSQLDQVNVQRLVSMHIEWILELPQFYRPRVRGSWLYALLTMLDDVLDPDTQFELMSLMRRCAYFRSRLQSRDEECLPHLNVLINLVDGFFGQKDPTVLATRP